MVTDLAHFVRVFPKVVDKLGLLNADTIGAVITAHGTIDAYCEHLLLMGGRLGEGAPGERRLIFMPADKAQWIKKMCEARARPVTAALFALEAERLVACQQMRAGRFRYRPALDASPAAYPSVGNPC